MNLIEQVYGSLKWKKTDEFCALKLGISLEKYQEIKKQIQQTRELLSEELDEKTVEIVGKRMLDLIDDKAAKDQYFADLDSLAFQDKEKVIEFKENLEDGTAEIKGLAFTEPKSPEEIIRILKIDQAKWKLSSYWNKQHKNYWLISAMVTQKQAETQDMFKHILDSFNPEYTPVKADVFINNTYDTDAVAILSIQDLHFGKEGNNGVEDDFMKAVKALAMRAYHSHSISKIIYVIGGDLLNMDTFQGQTTKGTPVDNEQRAQEAYTNAFDHLYWSINFLNQFCKELHVVYLPGNHDRLSSYHLAHALSKCFRGRENITFNVEYAERKVVVYGKNFFAFEHGDVGSKNTPLVYATEFAQDWGNTVFRTCYTGHWHKKKTMEYVTEDEQHGFAIKHLPSLCKADYWHYHNKFVGSKRQAVLEVHDAEKGKISEFTHNV
jgi:hypothetical protein